MDKKPVLFGKEIPSPGKVSEKDYLFWNLFRPLCALKDRNWIKEVFKNSYKASFLANVKSTDIDKAEVHFWYGKKENIFQPTEEYAHYLNNRLADQLKGYHKVAADKIEEPTEVDVVFRTDKKLILIQTLLDEDIEYATKHDPLRDQLCRIIDVGSAYAKKENLEFFFILLTPDLPYGTRLYQYRMHEFYHHPLGIKEKLPHRNDLSWHDLSEHIGWMTWEQLLGIWAKYLPVEGIVEEEEYQKVKEIIENEIQKIQA